jgi:TetR/AcrR family transcriptional regulator
MYKRTALPSAADKRTAILDAAECIFARDGLRASRTEEIAAKVGVTKAMIHYYFGTKERLYTTVLERINQERAEGIDFAALESLAPTRALEQFVIRLLEQLSVRPHTAALFALENIQNAGQYYGHTGASTPTLVKILERGIANGEFRRVDPRHAAVNIMGTCLHYFNVMQNVRRLWPKKTSDALLLREHAEAALDFVLVALSSKRKAARA